MSKELEALQDLSKLVFIYGGIEQYKIIEDALKRLEEIDTKTIPNMKEHYEMLKEERNILRNQRARLYKEKEKKDTALKIIKEKKVNIEWLMDTENVEEYNENHFDVYEDLTKEEYNLLKEVLE